MVVEIDKKSGFCFGVVKAIEATDEVLERGEKIYSLGQIVHNKEEITRLEDKGMVTINHDEFGKMERKTILFRAHGESPDSYITAKRSGHKVIDATCPVVLKLQQRVKNACERLNKINGQLVIFGKAGHAEVIGLLGQTEGEGILIEGEEDLDMLDYSRPIETFSQTTMNVDKIKRMISTIKNRINDPSLFKTNNTTCRQVSDRFAHLRSFSKKYDVIVFVGGKNSSNSKMLYHECKRNNENSYFVSNPEELDKNWFDSSVEKVGICGGTSTPFWLMDNVAKAIPEL